MAYPYWHDYRYAIDVDAVMFKDNGLVVVRDKYGNSRVFTNDTEAWKHVLNSDIKVVDGSNHLYTIAERLDVSGKVIKNARFTGSVPILRLLDDAEVRDCSFENIVLQHDYQAPILVVGKRCRVRSNRITNVSVGCGIYISTGAEDVDVEGNYIENVGCDGIRIVYGAKRFRIKNNTVKSAGRYGINVYGDATNEYPEDGEVESNVVDDTADSGMYIIGKRIRVRSNTVVNAGNVGVELSAGGASTTPTEEIIVESNYIEAGTHGIFARAKKSIIRGNIVKTANGHGVYLGSDSDYNAVVGNIAVDVGGYGIYMIDYPTASDYPDHCVVVGNVVKSILQNGTTNVVANNAVLS